MDDNIFFSYHERPKLANSINIGLTESNKDLPKLGIVLQGPLCLENNFTLETVKIYKKTFPNTAIIVSTWEGEDIQTIKAIKSAGGIVLQNILPDNGGPCNINFQIVSAVEGLKYGKKIGVEYAMKTRTDQRMYALNLYSFFLNLIETFPLKGAEEQNVLQNRLIVSNFTTLKYRPYGLSDMWMFGHINDILKYWDANLDERKQVIKIDTEKSILEFAKERYAETYLCSDFLIRYGKALKWTLNETWDIYGKYFCIIDHSNLDLYWHKYERNKEFRNKFYTKNHSHQLFNFSDWISIYHNQKIGFDEHVIENVFEGDVL